MRITLSEQNNIKQTVAEFDSTAKIFLFGSRADDTKKGGDIDLLIFSNNLSQKNAADVRWRLWEQIGEQKIDIVIANDKSKPFTRIALKNSVLL